MVNQIYAELTLYSLKLDNHARNWGTKDYDLQYRPGKGWNVLLRAD